MTSAGHVQREAAGNVVQAEAIYAITRHGGDADVVAMDAGRPVTRAAFLSDVAMLAARMPDHKYVLNLCTGRYRFMVGFAAALCRQQISLMPPGDAPGILRAVAYDYPDVFALTDTPICVPVPALAYPHDLTGGGGYYAVPMLPGAQPALILFTSGSTGRPVAVPKSWGVLVRSAWSAGMRLGLPWPGGAVVIGTVPHQHSYGLESIILLGWQFGLTVDSGHFLYPGDIRAAIDATPGPRILVTSPVHLRAMLAEPGGMPKVDLMLSATAPLSAPLAAKAEACFGAKLIEIYGCTEAGQVATRRTMRDSEWHCLEGVTLGRRNGGISATGDAVEGVAMLQDMIEFTGPGSFLLGGRSADLVDVAGKRASLAHLNHQLLSIPGVADGVFLMPEPDGRRVTRLVALVVAPSLQPEDVRRALRQRIDTAFLPRPLVFVDVLPRNALGKLPREAMLDLIRRGAEPV